MEPRGILSEIRGVKCRLDDCTAHVAGWLAFQGRQLTPGLCDAQSFLQALDPVADSFSFRSFSDTPYTRSKGRDPLERAIHGSLETCGAQLLELNRRGAAISVTINRTNLLGRTVADIRQVRALFVDDDQPPAAAAERFGLTPQIQVCSSPGHYHHYWLVRDLPLSGFRECQLQLAHHYGTDNRVAALNQSMQLPGFWRRKDPQRPVMANIHKIQSNTPYSYREIEQRLLSVHG